MNTKTNLNQNPDKLTLLAVMAHPDDETFGIGGTLAHYAKIGAAVHLVCATRGEAGDVDATLLGDSLSKGEYRESELRCAAATLGIKSIHFLGYRDSGMPGTSDNDNENALMKAPIEEVAQKIYTAIEEIRPQVIVTFDPIGGYRHPDHIAVHHATVKAFETARNGKTSKSYQPEKLYFSTFQRGFLRMTVGLLKLLGRDPRHFGNNGDIDLLSISEVNFPIHAKINFRSVGKIKNEASACYISQGGKEMSQGFVAFWRKLFSSSETFMRFYPPPVTNIIERDLFEGI